MREQKIGTSIGNVRFCCSFSIAHSSPGNERLERCDWRPRIDSTAKRGAIALLADMQFMLEQLPSQLVSLSFAGN